MLCRYVRYASGEVECEINGEGKRCFHCDKGLLTPRWDVDQNEALTEYNSNWGPLKSAPFGLKGRWSKPEKKKDSIDISKRIYGRSAA